MKTKRLYNWLVVLILVIVGLDQFTKLLVIRNIPEGSQVPLLPGVVHLTYTRNSGAAFSMFSGSAGARWMFLVLVVVFLGLLVVLIKKGILKQPTELFCMAAVAGGAIGNAIDRALTGEVVDMIEVEFVKFAVFNVADCFITCGAIAFIVYILFFSKKDKKEAEDAAEK